MRKELFRDVNVVSCLVKNYGVRNIKLCLAFRYAVVN